MEGLASYGSDDDYEESPQRNPGPEEGHGSSSKEKPARDNYEDVGMDLSENENGDTTESKSSKSLTASPSHTPPKSSRRVTRDAKRSRSKSSSPSRRSRDKKDRDRRRRSRTSSGSRSKSRSPPRRNQSRRKDDKHDKRDKHRKDRDSRESRDSRNRSSYSKHRSRSRDRDARDSRESRDSSRRHYRDNRDRDSRQNDYAPRDRYSKRFERASNKLAHLEKMGIDVNKSQDKRFEAGYAPQGGAQPAGQNPPAAPSLAGGEDRLLPPGVTGRLREQMERRKALWQKKPDEAHDCEQPPTHSAANASGKVWQGTTFAHDQEGKQANKFKRLMGIREAPPSAGDKSTDSLAKKQEELFSSMEQQYEVARTATHTMRGVGLGFGSYQR